MIWHDVSCCGKRKWLPSNSGVFTGDEVDKHNESPTKQKKRERIDQIRQTPDARRQPRKEKKKKNIPPLPKHRLTTPNSYSRSLTMEKDHQNYTKVIVLRSPPPCIAAGTFLMQPILSKAPGYRNEGVSTSPSKL